MTSEPYNIPYTPNECNSWLVMPKGINYVVREEPVDSVMLSANLLTKENNFVQKVNSLGSSISDALIPETILNFLNTQSIFFVGSLSSSYMPSQRQASDAA